ncbi:PREDICTED: leucine-rich repeat extensin-like protein 5 [Erythranthe guttata]|uniref:leucine-rich repeat extensin-like protein 5 n=1 Tax=Erythranthe guttata TaxID=4155 RepID=UPI00064DFE88|nr:PREDICTED: leucine-rich repeat extensin-like protein 5 [Erythranthe guttata]|eukprot:XP_012844881.1 PREDICTED: leucine-rich repeat extensin-like protein 5 [Erythranthe guttata]
MVWGESVLSAYPAVGPSLEYSPTAGWYPPDPSCPTTTVAVDGGGGYYPPLLGYAPDSDPTPGGFPLPPFYGYAPPPPGYGYTPPPVYGYAPPPPGYGYDPPAPPSMPDYRYTPQPDLVIRAPNSVTYNVIIHCLLKKK